MPVCSHFLTITAIPQLLGVLTLIPDNTSIMVSWTPPQYPPDSYTVSYSCQLLCGSASAVFNHLVDGETSNHTISSLSPGRNCTVSVTANFGTNASNTVVSTISTFSEGMYSTLSIGTVCKTYYYSSYWCSWNSQ